MSVFQQCVPVSSYPGFQRLGFVIWSLIVRGEAAKARGDAPREKNKGAFSNLEHSLFPTYFDNGPLEQWVVSNITFGNLA